MKYIFPDDGTHQVILRVNSNHLVELASFQVFVPHQSPPSILNPFPSSPGTSDNDLGILASKILAIALPVAASNSINCHDKRKNKKDMDRHMKFGLREMTMRNFSSGSSNQTISYLTPQQAIIEKANYNIS